MEPQADESGTWRDLKTRTISSAAMAVLVLCFIWIGGIAFSSLVMLAAMLMAKEWEELTTNRKQSVKLSGYIYIIIPCSCMLWIRNIGTASDPLFGLKVVLGLVAVISATDMGAYFTGKQFGYNKLCPTISPNKTWEGLVGGVAAATAVGILFAPYINLPHSVTMAMYVSPIIALVAQLGDLFKSLLKRKAGVKDTGTLIPGHGGLLDRLDGYMFNAPIVAAIVYYAVKEII